MRASPRQSSATAIVFAVNWPAHVPGPGQARGLDLVQPVRVSRPRSSAPTASQTSWIVSSRPSAFPARIGPL